MKTAVLLDLDECLIPDDAATDAALVATCAAIGVPRELDAIALARAVRANARELWRAAPTYAYCDAIGISAAEGLWGDFAGDDPNLRALAAWAPTYRRDAWGQALRGFGVDDPDMAASLAEAFPAERLARAVPFLEVPPTLGRLAEGRRLAIVTNGAPRLQRAKIEHARLGAGVHAIVVSGEVGVGKPDRRVFETALNALGARPEEAVMVGDNLHRDIVGAQRCGILAVWIDRIALGLTTGAPRPDATIATLDELEPLV
jgi:putative hydrolase of the HAD superfamily